ncbi:hypothetical protein GCM10010460_33110 [Microbacterium terrae]|nr:hypothetical protein GCM10017594_24570 [Microbacterium terrae]
MVMRIGVDAMGAPVFLDGVVASGATGAEDAEADEGDAEPPACGEQAASATHTATAATVASPRVSRVLIYGLHARLSRPSAQQHRDRGCVHV